MRGLCSDNPHRQRGETISLRGAVASLVAGQARIGALGCRAIYGLPGRYLRSLSHRARAALSWGAEPVARLNQCGLRGLCQRQQRLTPCFPWLERRMAPVASTAALTISGARKASDGVIRIERSVLPSRKAGDMGRQSLAIDCLLVRPEARLAHLPD
jgi:hypothetical protein